MRTMRMRSSRMMSSRCEECEGRGAYGQGRLRRRWTRRGGGGGRAILLSIFGVVVFSMIWTETLGIAFQSNPSDPTLSLSALINTHASAIANSAAQSTGAAYRAQNSGKNVNFTFTPVQNTMNFVPDDLATNGNIDLSFRLTDAITTGTNAVVVPWAGVAIAVVTSLGGTTLTLTMELCARIFSGHVTRWNDSEVVALNPSLASFDASIQVVYPSLQDDAMNIFELEMRDDYLIFNSTWLRSVSGAPNYDTVLTSVAASNTTIGIVPWLEPYRGIVQSGSAGVSSASFRDISGFEVGLDPNLNSLKACVDVESALDSGVYDLGRENYGCYPITGTIGIVADKEHLSVVDGSCDKATVLVDTVRWYTGLHESRDASAAATHLRTTAGAYLITDKSRAVELHVNNVVRNITCDSTSILATVDLSCTTRDITVVPGGCDASNLKRTVSFMYNPLSSCEPLLGTSVALPSPVTRDCDYVKSGSTPMAYAVACCALVVVMTLAVLVTVLVKRNHSSYKQYARTFYTDLLYLLSLLLISVNIVNIIGENTDGVCLYRMWCVHITSSLFLGALFQKIWETERYYNKSAMKVLDTLFDPKSNEAARKRGDSLANRIQDTLNTHVFNVEDAKGYYIVMAIVCFDVLLLTIWSAVSAPGTETSYELVAYQDVVVPVTNCGGEHRGIFLGLLIGYKLTIVCYALMLTHRIWNVRSDFNEIRLLSSVLPNCIVCGAIMLITCALPSNKLTAAQEAYVLVTLWTWQLVYALLAVFHFRMWRLFPTTFDNMHHLLCCCLPLPELARRGRAESGSVGGSAASGDAADAAGTGSPAVTTAFQVHVSSQGEDMKDATDTRARGQSASPEEISLVAIETMTKRLMEKDAIIAAKDARIRKLEAQLALVLHDLENDGGGDDPPDAPPST